jgi:hypothetical protein
MNTIERFVTRIIARMMINTIPNTDLAFLFDKGLYLYYVEVYDVSAKCFAKMIEADSGHSSAWLQR